MTSEISTELFVTASAAIVIAQVMILRSTRRGMRHGPRDTTSLLEWTYAVLPAVALVVVLAWTWRTMQPSVAVSGPRPVASRTPS